MNKTTSLWIILDLIFLVIFNTVFFVAGGVDHNISGWLSYGFIHFAYLLLLLTPKLVRGGQSAALFGFSLYSVAAVYFLVEFAIGVVFIVISPGSYTAVLLTQLCIAGIYGIILVSNMLANEYTAAAEETRAVRIDYVKKAAAQVKYLADSINDKETKKKAEKVYDTLYSSPVRSHPALARTEAQILLYIEQLGEAAASGDKERISALADTLLISINERNSQLKTLN